MVRKSAAELPDWMRREDEEEVVEVVLTNNDGQYKEYGLFDSPMTGKDGQADRSSISMQTLREISESYEFSLPFLGDYAVQLGCPPPIDVDAVIGSYMTGQQTYALLVAVTSLDPLESNIEYDSLTVQDLAEELGLSKKQLLKICKNEDVNLPFGMETVLHESVVAKIKEVLTYDEYNYSIDPVDDRLDVFGGKEEDEEENEEDEEDEEDEEG